jgi:hypothetical protein
MADHRLADMPVLNFEASCALSSRTLHLHSSRFGSKYPYDYPYSGESTGPPPPWRLAKLVVARLHFVSQPTAGTYDLRWGQADVQMPLDDFLDFYAPVATELRAGSALVVSLTVDVAPRWLGEKPTPPAKPGKLGPPVLTPPPARDLTREPQPESAPVTGLQLTVKPPERP